MLSSALVICPRFGGGLQSAVPNGVLDITVSAPDMLRAPWFSKLKLSEMLYVYCIMSWGGNRTCRLG